jgi:ubiquinone/menaquinone biosynthesis C-methylase UbiE
MSVEGVHPAAATGFQRAADAYRRGRPDYPEEAVAFLADRLGIGPGRRVLDLGAGTGKLTQLLAPTGASIVAVEPVEAMRAALASDLPEVEVVAGRAEAIPLGDGSVDAAVVAQAFHWFHAARALDELHRVLRDGALLALVWNVRDEERSAFWSRLSESIEPYRGDTPSHRSTAWRRAFERNERFTPLQTRSFEYEHATTREGAVDRVLSTSFIATMPDDERARMRDEVLRLLDEDPRIGPRAERFGLPYRTDVQWCTRR